MFAQLYALFLLALGLLKTLLSRVLRRSALSLFEKRYGGEGRLPYSDKQLLVIKRSMSCFACGRCDAYEGVRVVASHGAYAGMMDFVLASSRSSIDYAALRRSINGFSDEVFLRAEGLCPARVPIFALAKIVQDQGNST